MLKSGFQDVLDIAVNVGIIVPDNLEIKIPSKDRDKAKRYNHRGTKEGPGR